jgi:uncharacterized protein YndB with AHSA1/START domain
MATAQPAAKPGRAATPADDTTLRIARVFAAPPARVYSAFAEAQEFARWWGPKGCRAGVMDLDVRPGGAWRSSIIMPDGTEFFVGGVYREVVPKKRLVFTWAWENGPESGPETLVTLDFKSHPRGTELVLTHEKFVSKDSLGRHHHGWDSCFDCLADYLAEG